MGGANIELLRGAARAAFPEWLAPELATLVDTPPKGEDWLFEIKLDGYRLLAFVDESGPRLHTRSGADWSASFPSMTRALRPLEKKRVVLDGEIVRLDKDGVSRFQLLQSALSGPAEGELVYYVFDLLYCQGWDVRGVPLEDRKRLLAEVLAKLDHSHVRYNDHVVGMGAPFLARACELGLEGIIAKRRRSLYRSGRGSDWQKIKCLKREELVIGGFTAPSGTRSHFGALLVGIHENGKLRYVGKVGTGFSQRTLADLHARLAPIACKDPPFVNPPKGAEARRATWVSPELVAEVTYTEITRDGLLRHPSFIGLRFDKPAAQVRREAPASRL